MTAPMQPEHGPDFEVGGEVRRIVILTVRFHPCACYLARRLRDSGAEITLISQRTLRVEQDSWAYYRRLARNRGWACALDNFLLFLVKEFAALPRRLRGGSPDEAVETVAVLRNDAGIANEDWITCLEVDNINKPPDLDRLRELRPDLILLAGAPILSKRAIAIARVACVNPHCGISPEYAGSSPVVWPLCDGRFEDIGFTVHVVVPKVDSGPVLWQERIDWDPRMSIGRVTGVVTQRMYDKLAEIATELIRGKRLPAAPQSDRPTRPPAGLVSRLRAEWGRRTYAARRRSGSHLV